MDRLTGGAADSPFPDTTRGGGANIPLKIDPTALGSSGKEGGKSTPKPTTALEALRKAAETDVRARAELFRIEADKNRRTERVSKLMEGRFFSSAANTQLRAERDAERRAQDLMSRRSATDSLFGKDSPLKNMGELQNRFRQENPFGKREDFDRFVRDQQKTPEEGTSAEGSSRKESKRKEPSSDRNVDRNAESTPKTLMDRRYDFDSLFGKDGPFHKMGELNPRFGQENPFGKRDDFDRFVRDQQMTPEERTREEEKNAKGGSGNAAADPMAAIMSFLTKTFGDFKERVPQNALTT
jgi:hypothetical protein